MSHERYSSSDIHSPFLLINVIALNFVFTFNSLDFATWIGMSCAVDINNDKVVTLVTLKPKNGMQFLRQENKDKQVRKEGWRAPGNDYRNHVIDSTQISWEATIMLNQRENLLHEETWSEMLRQLEFRLHYPRDCSASGTRISDVSFENSKYGMKQQEASLMAITELKMRRSTLSHWILLIFFDEVMMMYWTPTETHGTKKSYFNPDIFGVKVSEAFLEIELMITLGISELSWDALILQNLGIRRRHCVSNGNTRLPGR